MYYCVLLYVASEQRDMRQDFGHLLDFLQHLKKVKVRDENVFIVYVLYM